MRYQVKWKEPDGSYNYGIYTPEKGEAPGSVIVEDAVLPVAYCISEDRLIDIDCGGFPNEYDQFVDKKYEEHVLKHNKAKKLVGRLFSLPVADGNSFYVITKENKKTVRVEWRGFSPDRYMDHMIGCAATIPKERIEPLVHGKYKKGDFGWFKPIW